MDSHQRQHSYRRVAVTWHNRILRHFIWFAIAFLLVYSVGTFLASWLVNTEEGPAGSADVASTGVATTPTPTALPSSPTPAPPRSLPIATQPDLTIISGFAVFIIGLGMASQLPQRMQQLVNRLQNRGALQGTPRQFFTLRDKLQRTESRLSVFVGTVLAISTFIGYIMTADEWEPLWMQVGVLVIEIVAVYVAGTHIGRMVTYGRLGEIIKSAQIRMKVDPSHIDRTAGLKPVGDFYFYQASILMLPAIFLASWMIVFMIWREPRYSEKPIQYPPLLLASLIFEMLVFVWPMWIFHREMVRQKEALSGESDRLASDILAIQQNLTNIQSDQSRKPLQDALDQKNRRYHEIERMKTWPLDVGTEHKFTRINLVLFTPIFKQAVEHTMKLVPPDWLPKMG